MFHIDTENVGGLFMGGGGGKGYVTPPPPNNSHPPALFLRLWTMTLRMGSKKGNDQGLIHSNRSIRPSNPKGKNHTHKLINVQERHANKTNKQRFSKQMVTHSATLTENGSYIYF